MTKPKRSATRASNRRGKLIGQLEVIFLEEGFRDLTVDDLAARLKCSKRSLYEMASSKQELFLLILEQFLDRIRHLGTRGALQHDDPELRLAAYMEPGYLESKKASQRFVEDIRSFRPAAVMLETHQRERMSTLRDIVEDGIRRGKFRKVNSYLVAEAYLATIAKIDDPEFLRRSNLGFGEAFAALFNFLAYGLFQREQPAKPAGNSRR
jgi:AcrR family transcriptional regulator